MIKAKSVLSNMAFLSALLIMFFITSTICFAANINLGNSTVLKRIIDSGVLRIGVNPQFKPFSFKEDNSRQAGVDIDIAMLLANGLGVKPQIVIPDSFSKLIPLLVNDEIDVIMAGMTINFKRAGVVAFTDPYFKTGLSILLNKAKGARLKISSATSYNDIMQILKARGTEDKLIIAVTKGKSPARSTPRYFPKAQIKEYPSNKAAAKAVADGAAHIMVHDEIFLKVWAYENKNIAMYKLLVFPKPFKADNYGFAIKKGNQEFLNMLNVFIGELYVEDYIKLFMDNYLPPQVEPAKFDIGESEL